jgi:hypothetical protein
MTRGSNSVLRINHLLTQSQSSFTQYDFNEFVVVKNKKENIQGGLF